MNWQAATFVTGLVGAVLSVVAIVFSAGVAWSRGELSGQVQGIRALIEANQQSNDQWKLDIKAEINRLRDREGAA